MTKRIAIVVYLGLWIVIAAGVIFAFAALGQPLWLSANVAFLFFIVVNGTLAYRYRSRQMRAAGQEPPSYLVYLLRPFATLFATPVTTRVSIPKSVRILLGIMISAGGLFFLFIAATMLAQDGSRHSPPLVIFALVGVLGILGTAFSYIGIRLIRERG
jgi:hypothetical protein